MFDQATVRRCTAVVAAAFVTTGALLAAAPAGAATARTTADETAIASTGGWSEETGAFGPARSTPGTFATVNHRGKSESKDINGTTHKRAHGWTTWAGVRHYTTARLEHYWPNSGVIATSGRKWGTGGTEAATAWKAFNPNAASSGTGAAKTYYGR